MPKRIKSYQSVVKYIDLYGFQNENRRNSGVDSIVHQMGQKIIEADQSSNFINNYETTRTISMCSINVCGLNSKLGYNILQSYIHKFDIVCLTETKCDNIDNENTGFKSLLMSKKIKRHKYGGIHGITIFIKEFIAQRCLIIHDLYYESILWIRINDKLSGIDLLLGAVYLPHKASDYYHEDIFEHLTDDIIMIKAKYQVPIVLLGDFNSRVGLKNDFEYEPDDEEICIDETQMFLYFKEHNLINRVNMDAYVNNNGKRWIELCKMSANGRIGRDKRLPGRKLNVSYIKWTKH